MNAVADAIWQAETTACRQLDELQFVEPVTHVYNPLAYAAVPHQLYLQKYARGKVEALLLGMNPGPFGMAQTGVPFGEVSLVRDWLQVEAEVGKPAEENPKRPIEGFACQRSEVSGARLWGWAKETFGTPECFFSQFYVHNYCPLVFMAATGRNITPDKLNAEERSVLYSICDELFARVVEIIQPRQLIGVGAFAEQCAKRVLKDRLPIGKILHPSPASPLANRDWAGTASRQLLALGIQFPTHEQ